MRVPRKFRALALCGLALLLTACRTEVRVGVDVRPDGAGTVTVAATLDAAAAAQVGDPAALALDDLRTAGWAVQGPQRLGADGAQGLRVSATRRFSSPSQLASVLEEVGGRDGVFQRTRLSVTDGFGTTGYRFTTDVRLSGNLSAFSDPKLTAALGGVAVGWTPEQLRAAGADAPDAALLVLSVRLPGPAPETNGSVRNGRAEWRAPLSGGRPTAFTARSTSTTGSALPTVLVGVGAVLLLAALASTLRGIVLRRRRRASGTGGPPAAVTPRT